MGARCMGAAPQALAAIRNGLISLVRNAGWRNIAAGLRHYSTSVKDALLFIGVPPRDFDGALTIFSELRNRF